MDDDDVFAFACGRCCAVAEAKHRPHACFRCGARFDRGAPHALVRVDIDVDQLSLEIVIAPHIEYRGHWTAGAELLVRDEVEALLDARDAQEVSG
jgi:hypothetical protein